MAVGVPGGGPGGTRSAAIPIVRPASSTNSPKVNESRLPGNTGTGLTVATASTTEPRPCRNIAIYGHCKFEDKGCTYSHGGNAVKKQPLATPTPSRPVTPSISTPTAGTVPLASLVASANVFVPKAVGSATPTAPKTSLTVPDNPPTPASLPADSFNVEDDEYGQDPEFFDSLNPYASPQSATSQNAPLPNAHSQQQYYDQPGGFDALQGGPLSQSEYEYAYPSLQQSLLSGPGGTGQHAHLQQQGHQQSLQHVQQGQNVADYQPHQDAGYYGAGGGHVMGHTMGGINTYLSGQSGAGGGQPLQYHLYQPPLPSLSTHPSHLINASFFFSPTLREELQRRQEVSAQLPTHKLAAEGEIMPYWGIVPLDRKLPGSSGPNDRSGRDSGVYGYRTWVYKATNENDGKNYALRRIEGFRLNQEAAIATIDHWSNRVHHPNIVKIKEAFTTRAFGDHSLIFVYDYHPLASTLAEAHLSVPPPGRGQPPPPLINERVLWSYTIQLASAIRAVHQAGMAVRCLDPSKILITGQNRVRINCAGVLDVIAYDGGKNTAAFQQEDLLSLGKLLLSLALLSQQAIHNLQNSLDVISHTYSQDFHTALLYLLSKPNHPRKNIDDFLGLPVVRDKVLDELNAATIQSDSLEAELGRELENGRLVRLLSKFGFINERPEYDHDPRWAETGDRYIIKLFRDYLFHQIDEQGRPVIDLSHVLTNLNKLDAGVDEQIVLVSRDEQSCLIVSYREIKNCLESSFRELAR